MSCLSKKYASSLNGSCTLRLKNVGVAQFFLTNCTENLLLWKSENGKNNIINKLEKKPTHSQKVWMKLKPARFPYLQQVPQLQNNLMCTDTTCEAY